MQTGAIEEMLTITYHRNVRGGNPDRAAYDAVADAFHESALTFGLEVLVTPDGATTHVTGPPRDLASYFEDLRASGIDDIHISRGEGDSGAEETFRAALGEIGSEVEIGRATDR